MKWEERKTAGENRPYYYAELGMFGEANILQDRTTGKWGVNVNGCLVAQLKGDNIDVIKFSAVSHMNLAFLKVIGGE